ncbi:MAG: DUF7453 family protein, partial [Candidatus Acidiferrales bacterium]
MFDARPYPRPIGSSVLSAFFRLAGKRLLPLLFLALVIAGTSRAQGGVPLIPVATDQSPLNLSSQFGVPAETVVNQSGDLAFIGSGNNALFFRAAGAASATRILQTGDTAPGIPGSRIGFFYPALGVNGSGTILFEISYSLGDGTAHAEVLTDESGAFQKVISSDDIAPPPDGAPYGLALRAGGINDGGDVSFETVFTGKQASTYFIAPHGGAAVRVASADDAPPPECTWCITPGGTVSVRSLSVPNLAINALGQILVSFDGGLFIGSNNG